MKNINNIYLTIQGLKFTIKEKHNRWHISFTSPTDGKRKNRSTGLTATKTNLVVVKNEILPQLSEELISIKYHQKDHTTSNTEDTVLENIAEIHFSLQKEKIRPHVYKRDFSNYQRHIVPYFKQRELSSIKPMELQAWQNRLMHKYNIGSIKKYRSIFYGIFARAFQNEIINKNPFDNVPAPKAKLSFKSYDEKDCVNPFTQREIDKLVSSYETISYMPNFIKFMANSGMRPGEIIALRWDDINLENKTINIDKSVIHGEDNIPKTISSVRCIDMIQGSYEALKSQFELTGYQEFVFLSSNNKRFYSHDIINVNLRKRLELLNIDVRSLYQLRHSFASRMIKNGIDITWVSRTLGHKNVSITLGVYTHFIKEDEEIRLGHIDKIDEMLKVS